MKAQCSDTGQHQNLRCRPTLLGTRSGGHPLTGNAVRFIQWVWLRNCKETWPTGEYKTLCFLRCALCLTKNYAFNDIVRSLTALNSTGAMVTTNNNLSHFYMKGPGLLMALELHHCTRHLFSHLHCFRNAWNIKGLQMSSVQAA